ncbi:late embryogenesis abundant protein At1g64065 [Mercurialis annua]|uniref:late embryogenesis abundant protein At1g64065 n=1 Tax=Mercurialis annua TaxID=3986 RepID=UPI00215FE0EB|nr:late embryogenesis abundant protein At1g64065 [Mercurialis annua]
MVDQDNQIVPLAPTKSNPRSHDEELAAIKPKISRQKRSSKCLVYILAGIVILGAVFLTIALIVFRPINPDLELSFVRVQKFNYANSNNTGPLSSFNMTLEMEFKLDNSNFGQFKFGNTNATLWYEAETVGEAILRGGEVRARKTKTMNVNMQVKSPKLSNGTDSTNDVINSGIMKMNCYAKFNGKVSLLRIAKRKSAIMDCSFNLNLRSRSIEGLVCD